MHVLGFRVWVLVMSYYIWLDFDEEVVFILESLRFPLVWSYCRGPLNYLFYNCFWWICLNLSQFMRICLIVRGSLHVERIGVSSSFRRCEWVMWVWPIWSLEIISSFLFLLKSAGHSPMLSWIWWSLFYVWSSQDFCHFLNINLLISSSSSVNGIFVLDICV